MTRGGWQVQVRKARQAAKASCISAPITISLSPAVETTSTTGSQYIKPFISTTSAPDPGPLVLPADYSPSVTPNTVEPAAAVTKTTERPSTPKALLSTFTDGHSPSEIADAATASWTTSAPEIPAARWSQISATCFSAVITTPADRSVLQHPISGKKLNTRARRKFAEAAAAAAAALESSPDSELSEESDHSALAQFPSRPPPTAKKVQHAGATAEYLGAELRRFFLPFPEVEDYESNKEREDQQEQVEYDLETLTAKIIALRQALQIDVEDFWQKDDGLESRPGQREKELQDAIINAELRISDLQSHTAQAHEEFLSFLTHKLAKQEEVYRKASHTTTIIIAILVFFVCAFLGLLIVSYL